MGCANSKQKRCKKCNAPYSPVPRSYSMHVHHQPQTEGDSYHLVALTSTTLGNLNGKVKVEPEDHGSFRFDNGSLMQKLKEEKEREKKKSEELEKQKVKEFSVGLVEAKTWSNMIEQRITKVVPKTPTRTPPGEPETINTWELMEGLEDTTPFRSPNHIRSFSFDVNNDVGVVNVNVDSPKSSVKGSPPKPMWLHMTDEEAKLNPVISDFDPDVISSFRKSLQQISPDSPFHLKPSQIDEEKEKEKEKEKLQGTRNMFSSDDVFVDVKVNGKDKDKVVFYFTSLRGVRKTYEDCCQVKMILRGLGVKVDERDVSMHLGFKEELRELLGEEYGGGGGLGLPRVFIGRNYIGGAEEIQRLHEDGKLEKLLDCCEKIEEGACEACGDIRFVPCETCFGSCKIYYEDEEKDHDDGGEEGEYGFQRCPDCNENGLTRCPVCCF